MVTPTTLSMAARALRTHIATNTDLEETNVLLGHPASVQILNGTDPYLSVYFFSVYPAANSADIRPKERLDTIVHCIVTPLAKNPTSSASQITSGEEDLRILGQVMACMHEWRLLIVNDMDEEPVCSVEIIPLELSMDKLSKIVPTQPEGGFRPTIAYELSLIPLFTKESPPIEPEVKVVTYGVSPDMDDGRNHGNNFPQKYINALIGIHEKDTKPDYWNPQLSLLDEKKHPILFRQITTDQKKVEFHLQVIGPDKGLALTAEEKKVNVVAEYWSPAGGNFKHVKEETITLNNATNGLNNFDATIKWELDSSSTGQFIFRVYRSISGQNLYGNVCLVVVLRKGAL